MRRVLTISALAGRSWSCCWRDPRSRTAATNMATSPILTGFATEPAFAGQPNQVQLEIEKAGKAVTNLRQGDVKVDVSFGGQSTSLTLEPQFEVGEWGTPGDYRAAFIPTQPGKYAFHVSGTVDGERGRVLDDVGAADTFSEVEDPGPAMFPAVDAPSTTDLSTKIDAADGARFARRSPRRRTRPTRREPWRSSPSSSP